MPASKRWESVMDTHQGLDHMAATERAKRLLQIITSTGQWGPSLLVTSWHLISKVGFEACLDGTRTRRPSMLGVAMVDANLCSHVDCHQL